ncbi:M14 family metallopeptidase [Novosphingobium album (ex Liu et al. 2023)]|uniref:M14 family metallopeptidase n=1 Tax=Novosphingobium album (ex Liu et al. 2023) TaxID=3031130 RepID=A0ABT5WMF3_9SPHN|nr:M14 metallopeptidase family protein [Novosphingobium album (ex Liu et al. 2023)]MDE8651210.1 M14 family metallopeptidase [Novosphingobium album (ex Liu et al. 2023)]
MRGFLLTTTILAAFAITPAQAQLAPATSAPVTAPEAMLPAKPGSDYFLANYTQISAWLQKIATESDRMKLISIGKTAEGREQYMAIVSSPENIKNLEHYRQISQKLALAKGLTDDQAHALAREGKAVVWIDAGLHATEIVNAQTHIQIIHEMLTKNDPETLRLLNDDIMLFVFANPDGLELVANWYMRPTDPQKRKTDSIPVLYQKYIGHDDNRDSFASTQPETTNMNRAGYREWFPQILYNQHQTGPEGAVVFIPPFRDPYNFNNEPLVINQTDVVGEMMHARLVSQGKGGSVMRSGAPYSTWFNGGIRTIGYFHNQIGILTEIIGNPTPMEIPLVLDKALPRQDEVLPIAPQKWHFQQSIDYVKEMSRAILDYASRYREVVLYNRYVMGRNQIEKGSQDSWVITPKGLEAVREAADKMAGGDKGPETTGPTVVGRGARPVPSSLYTSVLQDPAKRMPRAYILPADSQPDMPTTVKFLNALIKTGVEVERAPAPFSFGGKSYPAGSFVVRTDQAFRPHVLDMFEPQDHPHDFSYPGGPPIKPYDITGYTLALQMNVKFDRMLDGAPQPFPQVSDVMDAPPAGRVIGDGSAGYVVSHATNNSFILSNRLLKAGLPVFWLKDQASVGDQTMAPGALWIPASAKAQAIVAQSVGPLGIDAYAVGAKPAGDTMAVKPVRIGLVDLYGGSMASGWTRWIFENFEFPYTLVFPQELDKGGLEKKYDVLVFQSDVLGREGGGRGQPAAADIPAEFRARLGTITKDKSYPQIAAFAKAGGTVIAVGNAAQLGVDLGLPVTNVLNPTGPDGKATPLPSTKFYVPGSILTTRVNPSDPLAYGVPETVNIFYNNNPVFSGAGDSPAVRKVGGFYNDDPLVSGWAWGQKLLNGKATIVDASLGKGHVLLLAPEVTQRGQPYPTFKFLFNGLFYGPSMKGQTAALTTGATAPQRAE